MARAWGLFHKALLTSPTCCTSKDVICNLHEPSFPLGHTNAELSTTSEAIVHPLGPFRLRVGVESQIDTVIDRNAKIFVKENPDFQSEKNPVAQRM